MTVETRDGMLAEIDFLAREVDALRAQPADSEKAVVEAVQRWAADLSELRETIARLEDFEAKATDVLWPRGKAT